MYWPTFLIIAAFTLLERRFPLAPNPPWRVVRFNLIWQGLALSAFVALSWVGWGRLINWLSSHAGAPLLYAARSDVFLIETGRIFLAVAVADLLVYWVHRLAHTIPILWMVHRLHHDEVHVHAATSIRQHWLSYPIAQILVLPAAWLWGGDSVPAAFGVAVVALAAFHHSNINLGNWHWPPLLVGPQMHRIHHASARGLHDKNFAAVFPFWDMLFGTYLAPNASRRFATGLDDKLPSTAYWQAFFQPLADWVKMAQQMVWRK